MALSRDSETNQTLHKNNLYQYTNDLEEYKQHINPSNEKFDLDDMADMMIDVHQHECKSKSEKSDNRGIDNINCSVGYSLLNIWFVTNVNVPTC